MPMGGPPCPPVLTELILGTKCCGFTACSAPNPRRRGGPLRPPVFTELILGAKCCGFTACSVTAVTKTTGMITSSRRVLGSRNRGNGMFFLVSVWLIPPVVYASGLHQTRRYAHARRIYLRFWMLDVTACSLTNPLRRGGPLCPPAPDRCVIANADAQNHKSLPRAGVAARPYTAIFDIQQYSNQDRPDTRNNAQAIFIGKTCCRAGCLCIHPVEGK